MVIIVSNTVLFTWKLLDLKILITRKKLQLYMVIDVDYTYCGALKSPLDRKEIQPVHPEGDQSWVFIGGNDVEAETPVLWPPDAKSWLIW